MVGPPQTLRTGPVIVVLYTKDSDSIIQGRRGHGFSHQHAHMGHEFGT